MRAAEAIDVARTFRPFVRRNLFTDEVHAQLVEYVRARHGTGEADEVFSRHVVHNDPLFQAIHPQLTEAASDIFGERVKPSYCFLSMYDSGGVCPVHIDRPQCRWTFDYLIDADADWPIYVSEPVEDPALAVTMDAPPEGTAFEPYLLRPNDAVLFSGAHTWHYRDPIPGTFADLIFFHFVAEGFDGRLD